MHGETNTRSIAKAITYRLFGSMTTAGIVFFYSGNAAVSAGAGLADAASKIVLYYLHERAWSYVNFGRPKAEPEYEI